MKERVDIAMGKMKKCGKEMKKNKKYIMVKGREVEVFCESPPVENDPRVLGYRVQKEVECCATCKFLSWMHGRDGGDYACDLTPDKRGNTEVHPLGRCDEYKKNAKRPKRK